MRRVVLKYQMVGQQVTAMPVGAIPLHFDTQHGVPALWVEADAQPLSWEDRIFTVIGTGHVVPEGAVYRGTTMDGPFVWHLYETVNT